MLLCDTGVSSFRKELHQNAYEGLRSIDVHLILLVVLSYNHNSIYAVDQALIAKKATDVLNKIEKENSEKR